MTACGVLCCDAVSVEVAELFATLLRKKPKEKENKAKQQRSRVITTSAPVTSQHADRRPAISAACSKESAGDTDDAVACLFYGVEIPYAIINT